MGHHIGITVLPFVYASNWGAYLHCAMADCSDWRSELLELYSSTPLTSQFHGDDRPGIH